MEPVKFSWSRLNSIKDIRLISSMYIWIFIVPIAAKLLSMTNDIATITIFSYTFKIHLELPFSWVIFYFSALFFSIATIIYQTRCPRLIKEYPTYSTFEAEGKPDWHLKVYAEDIGKDFNEYEEEIKGYMIEFNGSVASGKEWTQSIFWELHRIADHERKLALTICVASYAIGFLLFSYIFIENFRWVILNILSSLK